jgi:hypothetical protein
VRELLELTGGGDSGLASFWVTDLAFALRLRGDGPEAVASLDRTVVRTRWLDAALLVVAGEYARAADDYREIGSKPDEALCRLLSAERVVESGDASAAEREVEPALAFFQSVGATACERRGRALVLAAR